VDIVRTLLQRGADRTIRDTTENQRTALEAALSLREQNVISLRGTRISDADRELRTTYNTRIQFVLPLFDPESPSYIVPPELDPRGAEEVPPPAPQAVPPPAPQAVPPPAPNPRAAEEVPPQEPMDSRAVDIPEDVPFPVIPVRPPDIPVENQLQSRVLLVWDVYHNAMNMLNHFTYVSSQNPELNIIVSELGIFTKTLFFIIQNIIPQLTTQTKRGEVLQHMQGISPKDLLKKCMFILNNKELINKLFADNETFSNYDTLDVRVTSETIKQNNYSLHEAILKDEKLEPLYNDTTLRGGKRKRTRKRTLNRTRKGKKYKSKRKYSVRRYS
jgi:hypothetical protein